LTKARERAQVVLDSAKPKIAVLTISIKGPRENAATVTVDGQPVSAVLLDADRPTDPGDHTVEATAPGFLKATQRVAIGPGDRQSVTLKLDPDPNAPVAPPVESASSSPRSTVSTSDAGAAGTRDIGVTSTSAGLGSSPNHSAAYIAWAFGGAALAVGAGFGAIALKDKNDLASSCTENVCPQGVEGKLNSAKTAGTVSTIGFGLGGAGLVLGTILYFTGSSASSGDRAQPTRASAGWKPRAWVGVGEAGFGGEF
jgi:hypothetical protein